MVTAKAFTANVGYRPGMRPMPKSRIAAVLLVGICGLALVGPAAAAKKPRPGTSASAVLQYVEVVPTAGGSTLAGKGSTASSTPLAAASANALRRSGGSDTKVLEQIATSPAYGAPPTPAKTTTTAKGGTVTPSATKGTAATRSAAPPVTVSDSSYASREWWVIAAVALVAVAGAAATLARTRRRSA